MIDLEISVLDKIIVREDTRYDVWFKKLTGGKDRHWQGKVGWELHKDTGTWQYRNRHITSKDHHKVGAYIEEIINKTTGYYREVVERLADRRGHGSARSPDEDLELFTHTLRHLPADSENNSA